MKKSVLVCFLVLLSVIQAMAQNTVTGKVTDSKDGTPLSGASITVRGSKTGTKTDAGGNFSISVSNNATLVVSMVNYKSQDVKVGTNTTLDIRMTLQSAELTEVVVTALGIRREKKALGYSVATVNKKDLELRPDGDVGRLLAGKAPGVDILSTSGLSGSGTNIVIRGVSTITGSNVTPLFIVDGVPFDGGTNNINSAANGFLYGNQTSSRFLDLDPNNIESVNVLKGLSATTLYGDLGRNGVIVVTTKNGSAKKPNKKLEVTVSQSLFTNTVSNLPDYQNTYGGGFHNAPSLAFSNWGAKFTDPPAQFNHPYNKPELADAFPQYQGATYDYKPYNSVKNFFRTGTVSNSSINISGFGNGTTFNANYSYLDDQGFTPNNSVTKNTFGMGGSAKLSNNFTLSGTVNYVITDFKTPAIGTSNGSGADAGVSVFGDLIYTPRSVDLNGWPYQNPLDGSSVYYRAGNDIQNPRWTAVNALTRQKANRTFGNLQVRYDIMKGLNLSYKVGFDNYTELQSLSVNKGGVSGGPSYTGGLYRTVNDANTIWDHTLIANYIKSLGSDWNLNVDAGANLREDAYVQSGLKSTQQLVFGLFDHSNFISHENIAEDGFADLDFSTREKRFGLFAQAVGAFREYLYLTVGGRESWTSTLEKNNRSIFYPSVSASFIPTTAIEGLKASKVINYLKVRVGYSTSARFPSAYNTRTALSIQTNAFVDKSGNAVNINAISDRLANQDLKPELLREAEAGVEAKFINNRLNLDLTFYKRTSKDQILDRQLDQSTGYQVVAVNAGSVYNKGIELALGYNVIKKRDLSWQLDANFTLNRSKVYDLPDDIKQIVISGFSNLGTFAINNQPLGVLQGTYVERDNTKGGQLIVDNLGNYLVSTDIKVIGDPTPKYKLTGISTLTYKSFSFRMQWDYTRGGDFYSTTARALLARGLTKDTDFDRSKGYILPGVKQDGTPNDIVQDATNIYFNSFGFGASDRSIWDATLIRLRELSISYALPDAILKKTPFGAASLTISGQNLWYNAPNFPKYTNFDPETSSFSVGNGARGLERLTAPSSRRIGASLRVSF
ncbi:MAG: SusC/RagA family TonB-linked outer membrane protein [Sphingobacteriales bacterium]